MQEAVDALIDNGRRSKPITGASGRALKSLSHSLKGKQGRFRQNLLGKRVDFSGRSVIAVGPDLKMYQCGIPREMAVQLFKPFVINEIVNREIASNPKTAEKLIDRQDPRIWDIVESVIDRCDPDEPCADPAPPGYQAPSSRSWWKGVPCVCIRWSAPPSTPTLTATRWPCTFR